MWGIAAAAAGGSIISGVLQSNAASDAADTQAAATRDAIAAQNRMFDITRADQAPWRTAGGQAVTALSGLLGLSNASYGPSTKYTGATPLPRDKFDAKAYLDAYPDVAANPIQAADPYQAYLDEGNKSGGWRPAFQLAEAPAGSAAPGSGAIDLNAPLSRKFTMEDFQNDPVTKASFDFGLSEGEKAVKRMFGASGLSRSGAAVKAATRFATDYTGTKAGESRDRFTQDQSNLYNRLAGVSGTGQVSATNTANNAMTMGANQAQLITGAGNANAASTIAGANAIGGAINNAGNTAMSAYWLNRAFPSAPSGGRPYTMDQFSIDNP